MKDTGDQFLEKYRKWSKEEASDQAYSDINSLDGCIKHIKERHSSLYAAAAFAGARNDIMQSIIDWRGILEAVGSPIEQIMLLSMYHHLKEGRMCTAILFNGNFWIEKPDFKEPRLETVVIQPQYVFGKYRADFLVKHIAAHNISDDLKKFDRWEASIIVECDGHDFHEKTKEQAAKDKRRDRSFVKAGFPVLRFTGSEIWNDPFKCADDVDELLERVVSEKSKGFKFYA